MRIEPVIFWDMAFSARVPNVIAFNIDILRWEHLVDDGMEFYRCVPRHSLIELKEWCRDRGLTVTGQPNEDGAVFFATEEQRMEFRMRWNV